MIQGINLMSVFFAAVGAFIAGMVWFSPLGFGRFWAKLAGPSEDCREKKGMAPALAGEFLVSLFTAFAFAYVVTRTGSRTTVDVTKKAVLIWGGFYLPALAGSFFWEKKPLPFLAVKAGHYLLGLVVIGYVVAHFR